MRAKIISDGTAMGTRLVNEDTGETIEGLRIQRLTWTCDVWEQDIATIQVQCVDVPVEIVGEMQIVETTELGHKVAHYERVEPA